MTQKTRVLIAIIILVVLVGVVVGADALRRQAAGSGDLSPGSIPIYLDGKRLGAFSPADLEQLKQLSFVDPVEGKEQAGWLLRDVLLLHVDAARLTPDTLITVSSTSREKSAQLTWAEVNEEANRVMFDLSNRGTLKLASVLDKLDTRDEWVQDVDKIEVTSP
ncbi:MAG: hypothetical protein JW850_08505 [Thermoflexales bacterium]|nr:hypothetical protein [Thermoflexales bacterium]